jgi:hypothetical protein
MIELEPEHDPGCFKVGFTMDLDGRLQKHRCSAPYAKYIRTWLCKRVWERAAIDCATNGCVQLHTEVFRTASLAQVGSRVQSFFAVRPTLTEVARHGNGEEEVTQTPAKTPPLAGEEAHTGSRHVSFLTMGC